MNKSYLEPTSTLEFLRVIVESGEMILNLPKEKLLIAQYHCHEILEKGKVTLRELSKPIGRLSFTAIAVLPASSSTLTDLEIDLPQLFRGENGNFGGCEERTVMVERKFHSLLREIFNFSPPQIIISSDASLQGWESDLSRPDNRWDGGTKISHKCLTSLCMLFPFLHL